MSKALLVLGTLAVLGCTSAYFATTLTENTSQNTSFGKQKTQFAKSCKSDMRDGGKAFIAHKRLEDGCQCVANTVQQTLKTPDWTLLESYFGGSMKSPEAYRVMQTETTGLRDDEWTNELDHKAAILFALTHCSKEKSQTHVGPISAAEACKLYTEEEFQQFESALAKSGKGLDRETCKTFKL